MLKDTVRAVGKCQQKGRAYSVSEIIPYLPQCATFALSLFFYVKNEFVFNDGDAFEPELCPSYLSLYASCLYDHCSWSVSVCAFPSCVQMFFHLTNWKLSVFGVFAFSFLVNSRKNGNETACVFVSFLLRQIWSVVATSSRLAESVKDFDYAYRQNETWNVER